MRITKNKGPNEKRLYSTRHNFMVRISQTLTIVGVSGLVKYLVLLTAIVLGPLDKKYPMPFYHRLAA